MLLNATKCQGYTFYRFWIIKGKPTDGAKFSEAKSRPYAYNLAINFESILNEAIVT